MNVNKEKPSDGFLGGKDRYEAEQILGPFPVSLGTHSDETHCACSLTCFLASWFREYLHQKHGLLCAEALPCAGPAGPGRLHPYSSGQGRGPILRTGSNNLRTFSELQFIFEIPEVAAFSLGLDTWWPLCHESRVSLSFSCVPKVPRSHCSPYEITLCATRLSFPRCAMVIRLHVYILL